MHERLEVRALEVEPDLARIVAIDAEQRAALREHLRVGKPDHDLLAQQPHHLGNVARILRIDDGGTTEAAEGREVVVLDLRLTLALEERPQPLDDDRRELGACRLDVAARRQPHVVPDHVRLRDGQIVDLGRQQPGAQQARARNARDPAETRGRPVGQAHGKLGHRMPPVRVLVGRDAVGQCPAVGRRDHRHRDEQ